MQKMSDIIANIPCNANVWFISNIHGYKQHSIYNTCADSDNVKNHIPCV